MRLPARVAPQFAERNSQTHERQPSLGLGPTGRVHKSKLPDNRAFWESVNAVEFTARGSSRREVYRAVAYFASLTDARVCFASVAALAKRASLGTTATRAQLRALERGGYIETDGVRSGGRSGTRYRLAPQLDQATNPTLTVAQPNAYRRVNPTLTVAEEVIEEVSKEVQAAQPVENTESGNQARHTCSCGNSWPVSFGTSCYECRKSGLHRPGRKSRSGATPVPGKYDDIPYIC